MATATRRRKHWGWGFEDQQPNREGVEGIARAVTDRLGFDVDEIEQPVPLDAVELRESRLSIPKRFAEIFSDDRYDRLTHALGKAYRDVVRGFRGQIENPTVQPHRPSSISKLFIPTRKLSLSSSVTASVPSE